MLRPGEISAALRLKAHEIKENAETFQDEAARQTKSALNLYLSSESVFVSVQVFEAYRAGWGAQPPRSSRG